MRYVVDSIEGQVKRSVECRKRERGKESINQPGFLVLAAWTPQQSHLLQLGTGSQHFAVRLVERIVVQIKVDELGQGSHVSVCDLSNLILPQTKTRKPFEARETHSPQ